MLLITLVAGCGPRILEIHQDDNINTAMFPVQQCNADGRPLDVDIVSIYASDLKGELGSVNQPLVDGTATAKEWFENRPQPGDTRENALASGRFWLPRSHIATLRDKAGGYGTFKGNQLRGRIRENEVAARDVRPVILPDDSSFFNPCKLILVFPKFENSDEDVLPVQPARFINPSRGKLRIKVGCDPFRKKGKQGQFIE